MSSRPFEKLLHLKLRASRILMLVLIFLHTAAFASVLISLEVNQVVFWLLLGVVVLSFGYYFKKHVLMTAPFSVTSVTQTRHGDWSLRFYNGENIDADLCDDSYKHPLFVMLNFKTKLGRFSVPLFPDAIGDELHRQLRCRLTLSRPAEKEKLLRR